MGIDRDEKIKKLKQEPLEKETLKYQKSHPKEKPFKIEYRSSDRMFPLQWRVQGKYVRLVDAENAFKNNKKSVWRRGIDHEFRLIGPKGEVLKEEKFLRTSN